MEPELELRLDPVFTDGLAELLQTGGLGLGKGLEGEVGERRPSPQRERLAQEQRPLGDRALSRAPNELLEPPRVDRAVLDTEHVARPAGLDRGRAERLPKL